MVLRKKRWVASCSSIPRFKQGQVAMEYLIIMGFIFFMIIPLTIIFLQQSDSLSMDVAISTASKINKEIIDKSEEIYYKGPPSKTTISAYFPDRIENITISSYEISMIVTGQKGRTHDINYPSEINLTGSLKTFKGVHNIEIESKGDYILITDK
jgi:uncharacterized protein (UPF0333 family)